MDNWRETPRARDGLAELLGAVALLAFVCGFSLGVVGFVLIGAWSLI